MHTAPIDSHIAPLAERLRAAHADRTPLTLRGNGGKDFLGAPARGEVLDTRACRGIVSHEPSELVVTVRCGTPLAELEDALAAHGQCLPFEPPHFGGATVGGMVAAGLAGPARAASGSVRDFVLGATLVNGRGQVLVFGGQVMKNVAGYDVSRLMAGSWGTLALIAEVSLKVLPRAPAEATLRIDGIDETAARTQLNRWAGQPLPINASCWADDTLWLRLRGARAAVAEARPVLGGVAVDDGTPWAGLREQTHAFFTTPPAGHPSLWRLSVPDTAPSLDLGPTLVEWGGAQRWVWRAAHDAQAVRAAAERAGGHATLWRAAPDEAREQAFTAPTGALARIHAGLRREFDPAGILDGSRINLPAH